MIKSIKLNGKTWPDRAQAMVTILSKPSNRMQVKWTCHSRLSIQVAICYQSMNSSHSGLLDIVLAQKRRILSLDCTSHSILIKQFYLRSSRPLMRAEERRGLAHTHRLTRAKTCHSA